MKRLATFGVLHFNPYKIMDEKSPIYFYATDPRYPVRLDEERKPEYILSTMEMDGYAVQLRIASNGEVRVSLCQVVDIRVRRFWSLFLWEAVRTLRTCILSIFRCNKYD